MKKLPNLSSKNCSRKLTQAYKKVLAFVLFAAVISSCIPNEKVVYLQNKDEMPELYNDTLIALSRIEYRLQPNDILLITFYSAEMSEVEKFYPIFARQGILGGASGNGGNNRQGGVGGAYMTGYHVDKNGFVEINGLGNVFAAGLTTLELEDVIEKEIKDNVGIMDIMVGVKMEGIPYTMFGEVGSAGPNIILKYEANILEAIASSGDLRINADRLNVLLMRQYPDGIRIHKIDVTGRKFIQTEYFYLQPHDLIYVPPLKIREIGTGASALANFATIVSVISSTALIISIIR